MSRFDLYASDTGYVMDLQSDYLEGYSTRVVAPVVDEKRFSTPASTLNPVIDVNGVRHVIQIHFLAAVPKQELKNPVGHYGAQADEITRALDLLFQGY